MAWPLTPFETAVSGATVKSTLLNAIQQAINWLFGGTKTVKQLHVDGTGGNASSVGSGALRVQGGVTVDTVGVHVSSGGVLLDAGNFTTSSGTVGATGDVSTSGGNLVASAGHATVGEAKIGTAMPTPACALGTLYKDLMPVGWGRFVVAGGVISMSSGVNVKAAVRNGTGDFTITFGTAPPLPGFHGVAFALAYNTPDVTFWSSTDAEGGTGNMIVNLKSRSVGTTPSSVDASFFLVAFCG